MIRNIGDIKWLAGLLEGEGTFGLGSDGSVAISVGMTDADVIERAAMLMGQGPHRPYFERGQMPRYTAKVSGWQAAGWMMTLYSLMGARRQARIASLLARWKAAPGNGFMLRRRSR